MFCLGRRWREIYLVNYLKMSYQKLTGATAGRFFCSYSLKDKERAVPSKWQQFNPNKAVDIEEIESIVLHYKKKIHNGETTVQHHIGPDVL